MFLLRVRYTAGGETRSIADIRVHNRIGETYASVFRVGNTTQREMTSAQMALAEAMMTMEAVEGLMLRCADEIMTWSSRDRRPTEQERARSYALRSYLMRQSTRVVDRLFELSGGHAIYRQHPLQQIWRDVHAVSQHFALHYEFAMEVYGRALVGLPGGAMV